MVLPAASKPTIRIRISFFPHNLSKILEKARPMIAVFSATRGLQQNALRGGVRWLVRVVVCLVQEGGVGRERDWGYVS